jgi:hypothetical protein
VVTFQKFPEFPPLAFFDGFDADTGYQMVPVREGRDMGILTEGEPLLLRSLEPSCARFANVRTPAGPLPTYGSVSEEVRLPAHARVSFSIMGGSAGHADVVVERNDGSVVALLLVSVKEKRRQVYNLAFLSDIRRTTQRSHAHAIALMERVEKTFLQQANLQLVRTQPPTNVTVPRDLKNPVRIDAPGVLNAIFAATPQVLSNEQAIIVYSVWDASDNRPTVGLNKGQLCFIDDAQPSNKEAALTFAHEIGHALGLEHNGKDVLMAGDGNSRTSTLVQFEIDTVNQSGLV